MEYKIISRMSSEGFPTAISKLEDSVTPSVGNGFIPIGGVSCSFDPVGQLYYASQSMIKETK